jgi:hypothetical protein
VFNLSFKILQVYIKDILHSCADVYNKERVSYVLPEDGADTPKHVEELMT